MVDSLCIATIATRVKRKKIKKMFFVVDQGSNDCYNIFINNEQVEAIMAVSIYKRQVNTAPVSYRRLFQKDLDETTFFEWLDEALTFAGDNKTGDITELELQTGEGRTKKMYAVRVHIRDA